MDDFILATVSTSDLQKQWLDEHHIPFISYTFSLDDRIFTDDCTEETKQMVYKAMREGKMPSTSQIPEYMYEQFFRTLLKEGKDILFVDMARAMSSSIGNCEEAIRRLSMQYPERRIHFLENACITGGLGILVMKMAELKEQGASMDDVISLGERIEQKISHRFLCDDLQWLRKGGRLSNASAIVGTLLSIKPLMTVRSDGTLFAFEKVRGRKKAIHRLAECGAEDIDPEHLPDEMWIWHADCEQDAENLAAYLKEIYPSVQTVHICTEGPVIGAHVGPGFISVLFMGKGRMPA